MTTPLTERQAFQLGFLTKCAEDHLSEQQTIERMQKVANLVTDLVDSIKGWANRTAENPSKQWKKPRIGMPRHAMAALIGLPIAGGLSTAYLTHKLKNLDETNEEDLRKRELINEMKTLSERMPAPKV